jgi:hypothetical protein
MDDRWRVWLRKLDVRWVLPLLLIGAGIFLIVRDVPPVVVNWETASEVGTAGFNLYRAPVSDNAPEQAWEKVNIELIPAQGDEVVGASYRFEDDGLAPGRRYAYRIEEVEWDGGSTVYPETAVVRAGLPRMWVKVEGGLLILLASALAWWYWRQR